MTIKYQVTVKQLQEMGLLLRELAKSAEYSLLPEHCRTTLTANADLFDRAAFQLAKSDSFIDMLQAVGVADWQVIADRKLKEKSQNSDKIESAFIVIWKGGFEATGPRFRLTTRKSVGTFSLTLEKRKKASWKRIGKLEKIKVAMEAVYYDGSAESYKECQEFAKGYTLEMKEHFFEVLEDDGHVACYCAAGQWLTRNDKGLFFSIGKDFLEANWEEVINNVPLFLCQVGQWDVDKKVVITEDYLMAIMKEFQDKGLEVIRTAFQLYVVVKIPKIMDHAAYRKDLRWGIAKRFLTLANMKVP